MYKQINKNLQNQTINCFFKNKINATNNRKLVYLVLVVLKCGCVMIKTNITFKSDYIYYWEKGEVYNLQNYIYVKIIQVYRRLHKI